MRALGFTLRGPTSDPTRLDIAGEDVEAGGHATVERKDARSLEEAGTTSSCPGVAVALGAGAQRATRSEGALCARAPEARRPATGPGEGDNPICRSRARADPPVSGHAR